jgi:hypothetical protein
MHFRRQYSLALSTLSNWNTADGFLQHLHQSASISIQIDLSDRQPASCGCVPFAPDWTGSTRLHVTDQRTRVNGTIIDLHKSDPGTKPLRRQPPPFPVFVSSLRTWTWLVVLCKETRAWPPASNAFHSLTKFPPASLDQRVLPPTGGAFRQKKPKVLRWTTRATPYFFSRRHSTCLTIEPSSPPHRHPFNQSHHVAPASLPGEKRHMLLGISPRCRGVFSILREARRKRLCPPALCHAFLDLTSGARLKDLTSRRCPLIILPQGSCFIT